MRVHSCLLAVVMAASLAAEDDANDYKRPLAVFGAWGGPVPLDVQAQTGLVPGEGIMVRWVRPGGPAAQMGIEPGDVILKLNDSSIASRADLRSVVLSNAPGSSAQAVVIKPTGDVAVLDGNFGERRTNRPLRPLSDDWERAVADRQREELAARADALAKLQSSLDQLDPDGADGAHADSVHGDAATADGASTASRSADGIDDAALPNGPWRIAMAFASRSGETTTIATSDDAPAAPPSGAPAWRLSVRVPAEPAP